MGAWVGLRVGAFVGAAVGAAVGVLAGGGRRSALGGERRKLGGERAKAGGVLADPPVELVGTPVSTAGCIDARTASGSGAVNVKSMYLGPSTKSGSHHPLLHCGHQAELKHNRAKHGPGPYLAVPNVVCRRGGGLDGSHCPLGSGECLIIDPPHCR